MNGLAGAGATEADATGSEITSAELGADGPLSRTVAMRVTDSDGDQHIATTTITVTNVPPTLTLDPLPEIEEGAALVISGEVTDPGIHDTLTLTLELDLNFDGDTNDAGETVALAISPNGSESRSFSHSVAVVPDDGAAYNASGNRLWGNETEHDSLAVTVTVADNDGGTANGLCAVTTVHNAAPQFLNDPGDPSNQTDVQFAYNGDGKLISATLTGSFTDPGTLDYHRISVWWGDGGEGDGTSNPIALPLGDRSFSIVRTFDPAENVDPTGLYPMNIGLEDDDWGYTFVAVNGEDPCDAVEPGVRPNIEFDASMVKAISRPWTEGPTPFEDGRIENLKIELNGISVTGACAVYRSAHVAAQALEDDSISRNTSESFYFDGPYKTSSWIIFRGADYNLSDRQWRQQIKGITKEAWDALSFAEQAALNAEFAVWRDIRVTGHQMAGTLNITYEYAAEGNIAGHNWTAGRRNFLEKGELTPPGHIYPYGRSLNADFSQWVQEVEHSADKPAGWSTLSTITIALTFYINKQSNEATVSGTITIDDIDGVTSITVSPTVA